MQNSSELTQTILNIVESVLECKVPDEHTNLIGLGASSMELIRIINRLEDETGYRPDFQHLSGAPTLAALAAAVGQAGKSLGTHPISSRATDPVTYSDSESTAEFTLELGPLTRTRPRSVRAFADLPVPAQVLGHLLTGLKIDAAAGDSRALYASAGALFPVQAYVYLKPERLIGMPAGLFRYEATRHQLRLVNRHLRIESDAYEPLVNAPIFATAAFAIFLIAQPREIEAKYSSHSTRYCLLEAGGMAQVLRDIAPTLGLGLCAIGEFAFERFRTQFALDPDQQFLHSFLGGIDPRFVETRVDQIMSSFRVS